MSEKTTLVDKLPPVAPAENTSVNENSFSESIAQSTTNQLPESLPSEPTISTLDNATYYGILGLFVFILLCAIVVFARRTKVESVTSKKALLFGGFGLGALAISAFASKFLFAQFLNQEIASYPLWLKPVFGLAIAPLLVMTIPYLVTDSPKAHKFFVKCASKATGAFALLAAGGALDLGPAISGVFAATAIFLGILFAMPLIKALRRLPGSLTPEAKSKVGQLGFMVIGILLVHIITGSLSLLGLPLTPILLVDLVTSFALITIIVVNLLNYISIQGTRLVGDGPND